MRKHLFRKSKNYLKFVRSNVCNSQESNSNSQAYKIQDYKFELPFTRDE